MSLRDVNDGPASEERPSLHPRQAVQVTFQYPVDIGDLLRFRSTVVQSQQPMAPSTKARSTQ